MSILHPEEVRHCKQCAHTWLAEHYTKVNASQPAMGLGITGRAQDLHRQSIHERRLSKYDLWRFCPSCNSRKTKTLKGQAAKKAQAAMNASRIPNNAAMNSPPPTPPARPPHARSPLPTPPRSPLPPPPPTGGGPEAATSSVADELLKLKALQEDGTISAEEYEVLRHRLIWG